MTTETLTLDDDIVARLKRLSHLRNENFKPTANKV